MDLSLFKHYEEIKVQYWKMFKLSTGRQAKRKS